jgi:hypothetical protein
MYKKLGRGEDAQAMLAKVRAEEGNDAPYFYAVIYAQWGDTARALDGLEAAMRLRNVELWRVKVDPYLDPLRNEPGFQAIERALRFSELSEDSRSRTR